MAQALATVVPGSDLALPALFAPDRDAAKRFVEFFTANIRNPNTRRAYARAAVEFAAWCEQNELRELRDIEPVHVAAYIETLQTRLAAPSVKQHLAAIRMLTGFLSRLPRAPEKEADHLLRVASEVADDGADQAEHRREDPRIVDLHHAGEHEECAAHAGSGDHKEREHDSHAKPKDLALPAPVRVRHTPVTLTAIGFELRRRHAPATVAIQPSKKVSCSRLRSAISI